MPPSFLRLPASAILLALALFCNGSALRAEDSPAPAKAPAPTAPAKAPAKTPDTSDNALATLLAAGGEKRKPKAATPADDDDAPIDGEGDDGLDDDGQPKAATQAGEDDDDLLDKVAAKAAKPAADGEDEEAALAEAQAKLDEAEADLDDEGKKARRGFTSAQQKIFDKEMAKKRASVREAKTELATKTAELEAAQAELATAKETPLPAPTPTAANPLAHLTSPAALDEHVASIRTWRRWCNLNPEGGTTGPDGKELAKEITAADVRRYLADSEEEILTHAPAQAAFLKEQAGAEAKAVGLYPWLKNPHAEQSVRVKAILRAAPQLATVADIKLILADHIANSQARQAAAAKPAIPAQKKPANRAPATPGGSAPPPRIPGARVAASRALRTFRQTGRDDDNSAITAALNGHG